MPASLLADDFLARLDRLDLLAGRVLAGKIRGDRRATRSHRTHSASLELADWRDYAPGDDPRFIDWNLCARLDRLVIKLFAEKRELTLHLLLDTSNSVDFGTPNKLHFIKQIAAAIGFVALANRHPVRISVMPPFSDASTPSAGMLRGRSTASRLLNILTDLAPSGVADFSAACRRIAQSPGRGGLCVILSDFLFREDIDPGLAALAASGHDLFCVQTLSPQEQNPTVPPGSARLIDSENHRELHLPLTPAVLAQYQTNLRARQESTRQSILRHGGTYVFAATQTPIDELVLNSLRHSGLLS